MADGDVGCVSEGEEDPSLIQRLAWSRTEANLARCQNRAMRLRQRESSLIQMLQGCRWFSCQGCSRGSNDLSESPLQ